MKVMSRWCRCQTRGKGTRLGETREWGGLLAYCKLKLRRHITHQLPPGHRGMAVHREFDIKTVRILVYFCKQKSCIFIIPVFAVVNLCHSFEHRCLCSKLKLIFIAPEINMSANFKIYYRFTGRII